MSERLTVTGVLSELNPPASNGWIKLKVGDVELNTKYAEKLAGATVGKTYTVEYESRERQAADGRVFVNNYLASIEPAESKSGLVAAAKSLDAIPPDVWEAKDRRIAMEACQASAARFYANRIEVADGFLRRMARDLYADVMAAGSGQPFPLIDDEDFGL